MTALADLTKFLNGHVVAPLSKRRTLGPFPSANNVVGKKGVFTRQCHPLASAAVPVPGGAVQAADTPSAMKDGIGWIVLARVPSRVPCLRVPAGGRVRPVDGSQKDVAFVG